MLIALFLFFVSAIADGGECQPYKGQSLHLLYATHFNVEYLQDGRKIVTDGADRKLLLVPRGGEVIEFPMASPVIRIPVRRVVTRWSTIPSLLQALGTMRTIVGVTTRREELCNEQIKERMAQGAVARCGRSHHVDGCTAGNRLRHVGVPARGRRPAHL